MGDGGIELGPGEIDAVAPVKFENRSGTTVSFRQADAPRTSAGDDVVEPGQVAAYAWDDPFGPKKLVVSVPGSEYATTVAVEPDPDTDDLDFDEDEDEDEETGMVTADNRAIRGREETQRAASAENRSKRDGGSPLRRHRRGGGCPHEHRRGRVAPRVRGD